MFLRIFVLLALLVCISGCATTELETLRMTNSALQSQTNRMQITIDQKNKQVQDLQQIINQQENKITQERRAKEEVLAKLSSIEESDPKQFTTEQIQIALKNAGFYKGFVDGKIGEQTKVAIIEFQKTHNLKIDGVIGKETWELLRTYLK